MSPTYSPLPLAFNALAAGTFLQMGQRIDSKFNELTQSGALIEQVVTKVIEAVKEKFDGESLLRTRFENLVETVAQHTKLVQEHEAWLRGGFGGPLSVTGGGDLDRTFLRGCAEELPGVSVSG